MPSVDAFAAKNDVIDQRADCSQHHEAKERAVIQNTGSMERGKCHDESARANNIKSVFCGGERERKRTRGS